jgi:hypothetical protein
LSSLKEIVTGSLSGWHVLQWRARHTMLLHIEHRNCPQYPDKGGRGFVFAPLDGHRPVEFHNE